MFISFRLKDKTTHQDIVSDVTHSASPLLPLGFMMCFTNKSLSCPQLLQQMRHVDCDSGAGAAESAHHTSEMTELECHTVHNPCAMNGEHP